MNSIYAAYKPLRNYLHNFEIYESLGACRQISNKLSFNHELSKEFEIPNTVKNSRDPFAFQTKIIGRWDLEFLLGEIIINGEERVIANKKSLFNYTDLRKATRYIWAISEKITENTSDDEFLFELNRLAHQQFKQEINSLADLIYRYYTIFSYGELNQMVAKSFNCKIKEIFQTGLGLFAYYIENNFINLPYCSGISFVLSEVFERFMKNYAITFNDLKTKINLTHDFTNDTLLYKQSPLKKFPLIIINGKLFCPLPIALPLQICNGLYYGISNNYGFDKEFGVSFQKYLESVLNKTIKNDCFRIITESAYGGKKEKKTADIIVVSDDSMIFIECKTKRMVREAKENIHNFDAINKDLEKISMAVLQAYKTIADYRKDKYNNLKNDSNKSIYVMVVTLEDWYINNNPFLKDSIRNNLRLNLNDDTIINNQPYIILSTNEFEQAFKIIAQIGIIGFYTKFLNENGLLSFNDFENKPLFHEKIEEIMTL